MHPLLTFSAGLLAGAVAVRWLKTATKSGQFGDAAERVRAAASGLGDKTRAGIDGAEHKLRDAAVAGLATVERSSARLRARLVQEAPPAEAAEPAQAAPKKRATRKKAAPKSSRAGGTGS